jgi:hypothetical protein
MLVAAADADAPSGRVHTDLLLVLLLPVLSLTCECVSCVV